MMIYCINDSALCSTLHTINIFLLHFLLRPGRLELFLRPDQVQGRSDLYPRHRSVLPGIWRGLAKLVRALRRFVVFHEKTVPIAGCE